MFRSTWIALGLLVCLSGGVQAQDQHSPDEEGYIRHWLVLAPIPLEGEQDGIAGLAKIGVKDEGKMRPKEGEKATAGGKDLTWRKYQAKESHVDFNDFLGQETNDSVAYAVCYLMVPQEMTGLQLKMGSDDQAKVYLNGKEVLKNETARPLTKDEDTAVNIALTKGTNVLVFKVVNEKIDFSGSIRFLDKDGNPVKNFKILLTPQ
jgi:hypothetical protein